MEGDRYVPILKDWKYGPVPLVDTRTGRTVHASECGFDDGGHFECLCGLEDAEMDVMFDAMTGGQS